MSRAIDRVFRASTDDAPPRMSLDGRNALPLARGLGSSAAAVVAGVALAYRLLGRVFDPHLLFIDAVAVEGHPDNVAAAIFGGFTIAYESGAVRLDPSPDLRPVLLVPDERLGTEEARRALPSTVDRASAVFNLQHSALVVLAITQKPELLWEALQDRLHQEARLELVPGVWTVFDRLRADGVPVCVSGSGPSLLAFERDGRPVPDPGEGWRALRVPVRRAGVEIVEG